MKALRMLYLVLMPLWTNRQSGWSPEFGDSSEENTGGQSPSIEYLLWEHVFQYCNFLLWLCTFFAEDAKSDQSSVLRLLVWVRGRAGLHHRSSWSDPWRWRWRWGWVGLEFQLCVVILLIFVCYDCKQTLLFHKDFFKKKLEQHFVFEHMSFILLSLSLDKYLKHES